MVDCLGQGGHLRHSKREGFVPPPRPLRPRRDLSWGKAPKGDVMPPPDRRHHGGQAAGELIPLCHSLP